MDSQLPIDRPPLHGAPQHWAVVGGGVLGLMIALRLAERGDLVTLFEAEATIGGLAGAWRIGDVTWDKHYHVTLLSDMRLRGLLSQLHLEDDMRWVETRTGFFTQGQLYSMSNTIEFLRFPPLNLSEKLRLGATIFYASKVRNWQRLERIPVADWLRRLSGNGTFEKIWLPLLRAKLGDNYQRCSAAFIWATIGRMYAARRSGLKKEMFGYLPGGYARLLDRFAHVLQEMGVVLRTSTPVNLIQRDRHGLMIRTSADGDERFDRVVVTAPAPVASRLCPQLNCQEHRQLAGIAYQGILCASLLLDQPLSPYYVTNITDDWVPFTAVIEMSALVDRSEFGGRTLIYLPHYVPADSDQFSRSDQQVRVDSLAALARMYPHFSPAQVEAFQVSRVKNVMALPTLGYSSGLPPMKTSVDALFLVNSAHIVNGTLNVNETIQLAERAVASSLGN